MKGRLGLLCLAASAISILLAASPLVRAQAPSPTELAVSLQKRYATIKDFRANFTHQAQGAVLRTIRTTEKGEIKVKKPGRVWMKYDPPQKKDFVADGTSVYSYVAADKTVMWGDMPKGDDISLAILFVAGRGDLVKDFRASMPSTQPPDAWHLTLTPIKRQEDFATMTLVLDRKTLVLRGMTTLDHTGGSFKFEFTNIKENVGLKDNEFVFTIPKNANVIRTGPPK